MKIRKENLQRDAGNLRVNTFSHKCQTSQCIYTVMPSRFLIEMCLFKESVCSSQSQFEWLFGVTPWVKKRNVSNSRKKTHFLTHEFYVKFSRQKNTAIYNDYQSQPINTPLVQSVLRHNGDTYQTLPDSPFQLGKWRSPCCQIRFDSPEDTACNCWPLHHLLQGR